MNQPHNRRLKIPASSTTPGAYRTAAMLSPRGHGALIVKLGALSLLATLTINVSGCRSDTIRIAIIPQTTGTALWNPVLRGAQSIARNQPISIYWNAPTNEDDVKAQITLLRRIIEARQCDGIVLAPDHSLALMNAVQDAMAAGIPVVVISSRLSLSPTHGLSYILNNDAEGGRMAAHYLDNLLHGHGTVAILGIDPALDGNMERKRSFESTLQEEAPGIVIVSRHLGSYNVPHEQQVAAETLNQHPDLNAIVALNTAALRGAWFTLLNQNKTKQVKLIGFDQDILLNGGMSMKVDAMVEQNTYQMGQMAMQQILDDLRHRPVPPLSWIEPQLILFQPSAPAGSQRQPQRESGRQP